LIYSDLQTIKKQQRFFDTLKEKNGSKKRKVRLKKKAIKNKNKLFIAFLYFFLFLSLFFKGKGTATAGKGFIFCYSEYFCLLYFCGKEVFVRWFYVKDFVGSKTV